MSEVNTLENYLSLWKQHSKNISLPYNDIDEKILTDKYNYFWSVDVIQEFLKHWLKIKDIEMEYLMGWFATANEEDPDDIDYYSQHFKYYICIDWLYIFYNY